LFPGLDVSDATHIVHVYDLGQKAGFGEQYLVSEVLGVRWVEVDDPGVIAATVAP
jgi:hypothetical protein